MARGLFSDLKSGLRVLRHQSKYATVVVVTLALGIGVSSTIYTMVSLLVFLPLPFDDIDSLVMLNASNTELGRLRSAMSIPDFDDVRQRAQSLDGLAGYSPTVFTLTGTDEPARVVAMRATGNYFEVIGLPVVLGRAFSVADGEPGADRVVVLSHGAWERRFGSDPAVLGREISLDGSPYTILGVLTPELAIGGFARVEMWVPLVLEPASASRQARGLQALGRLASGATIAQADAELSAISLQLAQEHPLSNAAWGLAAVSFFDGMVGPNGGTVLLLMSIAVIFVMLIACVNVANMTLARAAERQRELAVRAVLGAGRGRLARQLLLEGGVLALLAAGLGLLVTHWIFRSLVAITNGQVSLFTELEVDGSVLAFGLLLAMLTPIAFAVLPAMRASMTDLQSALREGDRGGSSAARQRVRAALVALQVAMAVVLLVVGGLAVRSVIALTAIDLGFEADGILTLSVELPKNKYADSEKILAFFESVTANVGVLPGVDAAGLTSHRPIIGGEPERSFHMEGRPAPTVADVPRAGVVVVTPGYFDILLLPLQRGRSLHASDDRNGSPVTVISAAAAARHWPGADPIGARLRVGEQADDAWIEVVGVVADVRNADADQPPEPLIYLPLAQAPRERMALMVRGPQAANTLGSVQGAIWALDPDQPLEDVRTMERIVYDDLAGDIAMVGLLSFFALVALCMAVAGVYSVTAYSVSRRVREIGIRMALGAKAPQVLRMVMLRGLLPVAAGSALGLLGGALAANAMTGMLYGVEPLDPLTFFGVPTLLAVVALIATLVPAAEAAGVDPMQSLISD